MMNKRNLLNLALLVFILVAATAIIFDSPDKKEKNAPITSLTRDKINDITIKRPDKKDIYLKKTHNKWRLIKPYNTATNQFRIDTLLRLVETRPKSSYPLKNADQYGLQKPRLEVLFNRNSKNPLTIKFGDSEPIRMLRYIAVGNQLYLTNDTFLYALNSVATDYISHKLLPDDFKIRRLDTPDISLQIKDNKWQANPRPINFSIDSVNELLTEWQNAQATKITAVDTPTDFSDKYTIRIYGEDASTFTFNIIRNDKDFILVNPLKGLQYSLPKDKQDQLLKLPELDINKDAPEPD